MVRANGWHGVNQITPVRMDSLKTKAKKGNRRWRSVVEDLRTIGG